MKPSKDMNLYYRPVINQSGKTEAVKLFGCDCGQFGMGA
jgi:hypothetical protein